MRPRSKTEQRTDGQSSLGGNYRGRRLRVWCAGCSQPHPLSEMSEWGWEQHTRTHSKEKREEERRKEKKK